MRAIPFQHFLDTRDDPREARTARKMGDQLAVGQATLYN